MPDRIRKVSRSDIDAKPDEFLVDNYRRFYTIENICEGVQNLPPPPSPQRACVKKGTNEKNLTNVSDNLFKKKTITYRVLTNKEICLS